MPNDVKKASEDLGNFQQAALRVARSLSLKYHLSVDEHDQEWQRVNSYIADILKDTHVLYAKLARLQGDFVGAELSELERIAEKVLDLGEVLSQFMKAFHSGDASMFKTKSFGNPDPSQGGGQAPPSPEAPPPPPEGDSERSDVDYESEIRSEEDGEFEEFDSEFSEEKSEE